jgi:hypothetical protein
MGALPDYRMIADLIKRGLTIETQEKIMELRDGGGCAEEGKHKPPGAPLRNRSQRRRSGPTRLGAALLLAA